LVGSLVSICVPTRNRANQLRESLKSICAQDYSPMEILISDNCSNDNTEQVCRDLTGVDTRIRYVRHPTNIGLHRNHNFCIDASRGEFLCIFHDHDERDHRIVTEYVRFLHQHPKVGVVCSDWELIDDAGQRIGVRDHRVKMVTSGLDYIGQTMRSGRSSIGIPGAMVRKSALTAARFRPDAPIGFGDFPLWFRVAETWDVGHIAERLWSWRQNRESLSARPIEAISHDYHQNLSDYCDDHLARWPDHANLVEGWRASIRRYLFWALAYEVALHFRRRDGPDTQRTSRSLFEIMDYRLSQDQFQHAVEQMKAYRTGAGEYATFAIVQLLIHLRLGSTLAWLTRHRTTVRALLGLE
jgi:glycosyltransferase involved in cell wall biosynthesis